MARVVSIQIRRGTRAQLNTAAAANLLLVGEPYLITDENRYAIGTAVNAYTAFLKSGVDDNVVLPTRIGTTAAVITDWNNAITNGWYEGNGAANAPPTSIVITNAWLWGRVEAFGVGYVVQTVWPASSLVAASNTQTAMRVQSGGVWGAWFKLQLSQAEQDARYLRPDIDSALSAGIFLSSYVGDGSKSGGVNYVPTYVGGNMRLVQNGGPFNFYADTDTSVKSYTSVVLIQNSASAGAVTFVGWSSPPKGDTLTTVNGALFMCYITKHGSIKTINIQAI